MKHRLLQEGDRRTFAVVFDTGDEAMAALLAFAEEESVRGAYFSGIGALSRATLAFYDLDAKEYRPIPVTEQVELASFLGNLTTLEDGALRVHAHAVVAGDDGTAVGGHVLEAHVRPTLELFVVESTTALERSMDDASGLPLIAL